MEFHINKTFQRDPIFVFLKKQKMKRESLVVVGYHHNCVDQIKEFDHKHIRLNNETDLISQKDLLYCYKSSIRQSVQSLLQIDEEVVEENLGPLKTKIDMLRIPKEILTKCFDENRTIEITMRNGHVFKGQLQSYGMISLFLQINSRIKIAIFRHGIYDLSYRKTDPLASLPSPMEQSA